MIDQSQAFSASDTASGEPSATQIAYNRIRRLILSGDLPPGEKLKIEQLRTLLDAGASPVREALSLLTSDLLVERIDQRGFRTAPVGGREFRDILHLRCVLEELALRDCLENATAEWEDSLVLAHHRMLRAPRDDVEAFEARHKAFHMALLANCQSRILSKLCSQLYDLNIRYRYLAGKAVSYGARDVAQEHREILGAAVDGDADLASARLLSHYRKTGAYLSDYFEKR